VSTLLHATVYMFVHNLQNVLVQIANKMGSQKRMQMWLVTVVLKHKNAVRFSWNVCYCVWEQQNCKGLKARRQQCWQGTQQRADIGRQTDRQTDRLPPPAARTFSLSIERERERESGWEEVAGSGCSRGSFHGRKLVWTRNILLFASKANSRCVTFVDACAQGALSLAQNN
jgi:hypothetical protein